MDTNDEGLECTICMEIFTKPKFLPCFHTYCLACIDRLIKATGQLICPNCRKVHAVPTGGAETLTTNFYINDRAEQRKRKGSPCGSCKATDAEWFCVNCKQGLCTGCKTTHDSISVCQGHCAYSLTGDITLEMTSRHRFCGKHEEQDLKLYCLDCSQPICTLCKMTLHASHSAEDIQDAVEKAKAEFEKLKEKLAHAQNILKQELDLCEKGRQERLAKKQEQEQEINQMWKEIIQRVDTQRDVMLNTLSENCDADLNLLDEGRSQLESANQGVLSVIAASDEIESLHGIDMMEMLTNFKQNVNSIFNTSIPSRKIKNLKIDAGVDSSSDFFRVTEVTPICRFQERVKADLKAGQLVRSKPLQVGHQSFTLDLKRWKDRSFKPHPTEQLGVFFRIRDANRVPIKAYIRVQLLRYGSDYSDAYEEEGEFTFYYNDSGSGWNRFLTWEQVIEPEERFVKFDELIFNIYIAVKEDST